MRVERTKLHGEYRWHLQDLTAGEKAVVDTKLWPHPAGDYILGWGTAEQFADVAAENLTTLLGVLRRAGPAAFAPRPWPVVLRAVADVLDACRADWFLVGSAAVAVRGIAVDPGDIDVCLLGGVEEAQCLCQAMHRHLIFPLRDMGRVIGARWFSRAWLRLAVEWMADPDPDADAAFARNGSACEWGRTALGAGETVEWDGRCVRLPPLWLQLQVADQRLLFDRADRIREAMR